MRLIHELSFKPMPMWQRWLCVTIAVITSPLWVLAFVIVGILSAVGVFDEPKEK